MADERSFYEPVRKWLVKRGYYTGGDTTYASGRREGQERYFTTTGVKGLEADVVGLRFAGNDVVSDVEVCVVEVKDSRTLPLQHIHQAFGYKAFAHVVYLASPAVLDDEKRAVLRDFGVGYLQLRGRDADTKVKVCETPQAGQPRERDMLQLLDRLWFFRCTICRCYAPKWDTWDGEGAQTAWNPKGQTYFELKRPRVPGSAREILFGLSKRKNNELVRRYVCLHCVQGLDLEALKRR